MNKLAILGLGSVAALALAACNPANNDKSAEYDAATTAPAATAPSMLDAPKPGLWRVTTAVSGMPNGTSIPPQEICIKQAKLEAPSSVNQAGAECTNTAFTRQGADMVATASCKLPNNIKSDSTIKVSGDFNSRYVTEVTTKMDPAPTPAMAETKMTMTAERLGDCPAGS